MRSAKLNVGAFHRSPLGKFTIRTGISPIPKSNSASLLSYREIIACISFRLAERNQVFPRVKITFWHTSQSVVADWADNHAYDVLGVKAALRTREAAFQDLQFTVIFLLTHADYD